jgi:hypothetical protein
MIADVRVFYAEVQRGDYRHKCGGGERLDGLLILIDTAAKHSYSRVSGGIGRPFAV